MEVRIGTIAVVSEFLDVFFEEIPGLPPIRTVQFTIDIIPKSIPVCKPPYQMEIVELNEVKRLVDDLLKLVFV